MLSRVPRLALLASLALLANACGSEPSEGSDPTVLDGGADAGVEIGFGPGGDAGSNDNGGADTADTLPPGEPIGAACELDDDCASGSCLADERFPSAFCSLSDCTENADCGDGAVCIAAADGSYCAGACENGGQCDEGWDCLTANEAGDHACVPPPIGPGLVDGEPCTADEECRGGTCIDNADWPGGYCTTLECETFEDCASDGENNRCLIRRRGTNFCVRMCTGNDDCRDGYVCEALGGDAGYCSPNPFQPPDVDVEAYPFEILCQDTNGEELFTFDYTVADDTVAYMVMPFAADGRTLVPYDIDRPVGDPINLRGANDFQLAGTQIFGYLNPTVIPATPDFAHQLEPGVHTYAVETDSERICHYLLEENTLGTTLDINIYLVGVEGVTAQTAAEDEDITAMLEQVEAIYGQAGIALGEVRFYDPPADAITQYAVLRDEDDLDNLVALSAIPGDTQDEVLSANVFFVRTLADGTGAIGVSMGLPGPAALHGTGASGVVFTSEFLGQVFDDRFSGSTVDGNLYTGVVFAHEVGHYLGLFHTSEQFGFGFDPLSDTPQCSDNFPDGCDDLNNLMFPLAGIDHTEVSEAQSWVLAVNPLTKE